MGYARRSSVVILGAVICMLSAGAAPEPEFPVLAQIVQHLGSDDFAVREAAQRDLGKISADQIGQLRQAVATAEDAEVKARLEVRVSEMEVYALLHPPMLSVDLQNASLTNVAAALNKQMGGEYLQATAWAGAVTLRSQNQPLWDILRDVDSQVPLTIGTSSSALATGALNTLRLNAAQAAAAHQNLYVTDGFAYLPRSSGTRSTGNWSLGLTVYCDPRVRLAQYSSIMQIEKLTDQAGRSLMPRLATFGTSLSSPARPVSAFTTNVTLIASPDVSGIKELRGKVTVAVVEREKQITFDMEKGKLTPIETTRGTFSMEKQGDGTFVLKLSPEKVADATIATAARTIFSVQMFSKAGSLYRSTTTNAAQISIPLTPPNGGVAAGEMSPARVDILFVEKTREVSLPLIIKDFELPADAAPARGGGVAQQLAPGTF